MSIYLSTYLHTHLSIYLFICLSVSLPIWIHPLIYAFTSPCIYPSTYPSISIDYLSSLIYLPVYACLAEEEQPRHNTTTTFGVCVGLHHLHIQERLDARDLLPGRRVSGMHMFSYVRKVGLRGAVSRLYRLRIHGAVPARVTSNAGILQSTPMSHIFNDLLARHALLRLCPYSSQA